jgi:hypothetical protein
MRTLLVYLLALGAVAAAAALGFPSLFGIEKKADGKSRGPRPAPRPQHPSHILLPALLFD